MRFRYRFQPYGLPNPGNWRIPNPMWIVDLFTPRLRTIRGRIPYADSNILGLSFCDCFCNVNTERINTTLMISYMLSIYIDIAFPINSTKMQQDLTFVQFFVDADLIVVPKGIIFRYWLSNTRKG